MPRLSSAASLVVEKSTAESAGQECSARLLKHIGNRYLVTPFIRMAPG